MFTIDAYTPARVIFGAGRLKELGSVSLPGKKALICVTQDGLKMCIRDRYYGAGKLKKWRMPYIRPLLLELLQESCLPLLAL